MNDKTIAPLRFDGLIGALVAIVSCAAAGVAQAAVVDVLWYSYAHDASEYKATIGTIAANAGTYTLSVGNDWNLAYFGPSDPAPDFTAFDVLVIHTGEAFRTGPNPGPPYATPDFSGILDNRVAIEAARGSRTFISGSDADFHAVRGDTGAGPQPPATEAAWNGGLGYVVNSIDWAVAGTGLNVVSFYDGQFDESFWWENPDSFLRDELFGHVSGPFADNTPFLSPALAALPVNTGLTTTGLSNWSISFHGGFSLATPGYEPTVLDDALNPQLALSIFRDAAAIPIPAAFWMLAPALFALHRLGGKRTRRCS